MAAHSYGYIDENGLPTDSLVDYVAERAKGGAGLVVLGASGISHEGALNERMILNLDERIIPRYQKISDEVHKYGCLVFDQIMHAGGQLEPREGKRIVAPSAIPHEAYNSFPVELTVDEINKTINDFVQAARRAQLGGLDGIELKCDQGYLIQQFLTPYYNRRDDEYGGSYENRLRFLVETLDAIRRSVGDGFVVGIRITGDSMAVGEMNLDDAIRVCSDIENRIDYIHVNGATNSTYLGYQISHGDSSIAAMNFAHLARAIKKKVKIPVIAASMILHPYEAEQLIESGSADLVAMTRAHIADAEIVNKVTEDRVEDIRPCIICNQGCVGNHWNFSDVRCIHNAATGRERELGIGTLVKSLVSKRVMVVGGGPAGLEVARVLSARGHEVELFERNREIGGQLILAAQFPYRQGFRDIIHYLETQIRKQKVVVHRGVRVTPDDLIDANGDFDAIVIATGAELSIPPIYENVDADACLTISDAIKDDKVGGNILIVDADWRRHALSVAESLIQRQRKVTMVSSDFYVSAGADIISRVSYYSRLQNKVTFIPLSVVHAFKEKTVYLRNVLDNSIRTVKPIDQIIFATGVKPNNELYNSLKGKLSNLFQVGDCVDPLGVPEAVLAANRLARRIF